MNLILLRLTRRYVDRRLLQSLLFVAGIALGVAVGVAIDLANGAASRAFSLSVGSVTGRTTHQIVGSSGSVPTALYRTLRVEAGVQHAAPVIEATVRAESLGGRAFRLLGVDPFAEAPFRSYLTSSALTEPNGSAGAALFGFLTEPGAVLISRDLAAQEQLAPGDTITLRTRTRSAAVVTVAGFLAVEQDGSESALGDLIVADIATAQEIAGQPGALTRIDLILPAGADLSAIEALLPPGAALVRTATNSNALAQMTEAFELNLQALGLLALLIGVFLIYNTVTFSVVQRRPMIGILRAIGATRRQIFALILAEAVLLGFIGTIIGLGLGIVLGRSAVGLVAQTVNDLYFRVSVERVVVPPDTLLRGLLIGLGASVVAAIVPSLEATRTSPAGVLRRSEVEQRARRLLPALTLGALLLMGGGIGVLRIDTRDLVISFAGLFMVLIGGALLTPLALVATMRLVGPGMARVFGVLGRMAPRAITRSLSRTSVAVAALTLAV
ncbi:MAG: FtsX-like permease family protein, partial [Anaerolineae bacterium]|nr:FtsX-like permease family protein [Anaerolineae bacterium]